MLKESPANKMLGRGHVRYALDLRNRSNRERVTIVKILFPKHYVFTYNQHCISAEAYAAPIEELRQALAVMRAALADKKGKKKK